MTIELEGTGHSLDISSISIQVLEQAPDGIAVVDHNGRIVFFNTAAEALWGMPRAEALGKDMHAVAPGAMPASGGTGTGRCAVPHRGSRPGRELAIERRDGERRWLRVSVSTINAPGRPALYCAIFGDITTQRRRAQECMRRLRAVHESDSAVMACISVQVCALMLERDRARAHIHELAFYDPLTRLPNRSMLQMMAGPMLDEARASRQPAAVLLIDLDHFKHINDAQGYAAGDALLRDLARRLQACVRENDIVARLVGDEFVILLPCCGADQAVQLIRRLSCEILSLASLDTGLSQHAEASFGVALFPADGDSLDMLLHHADMAMSQAKANGRNGYCFFSAEINQAVQERAVLEASLRLALREDGLELHYQPQLDIGGRRLAGVEALLRWNHPTLGAVSPLRIVALAEAAGLIGELGHWCVSRACAQMAQWEGAGLRVPRVSVNLTAANFKEAELPAFLSGILREHGLAPRRLTLELTEHGMLEHGPVLRRTIAAIHDHGISLSMDDFGTGYSSLGYLHRLPFDEIKLDKSFIQDLEHNEAARALTTSVLRIGEMLCMRVVAEGVETEFQRRFLAERGQPIIQGYLFARPMAAAGLQQWMADRRRR